MARPPRDRSPGLHHVTVGATGRESYYIDDVDRMTWTRRLVRMLAKHSWTCLLLCQLTTHVHLLVDVPDESLPNGMHYLNHDYSAEFNERHGRRGCLVRSRYWSKPIRSDAQLLNSFHYVARNPVRAGLCERAEQWPWSSVATTCGVADTFPFVDASRVVALFGEPPAWRAILEFLSWSN